MSCDMCRLKLNGPAPKHHILDGTSFRSIYYVCFFFCVYNLYLKTLYLWNLLDDIMSPLSIFIF